MDHIDICSHFLHEIINFCIKDSEIDDTMKRADITPVHKKDDKTDKSNYRPHLGSKIFQEILHKQIGKYIETFLSKYLCMWL